MAEMSPKAMKVMKKPAVMKRPAKADDVGKDMIITMKIKNGNSGETFHFDDAIVGAKMTAAECLKTQMLDTYDWEDEEEMEIVLTTAVVCTTFKVNGNVVDGNTELGKLMKAGDKLSMKTAKFKIHAGAVIDVEEDSHTAKPSGAFNAYGSEGPTGTFKKNNLK